MPDRMVATEKYLQDLLKAAKPFVAALDYNPGHSDLDNEQPITLTVTLGDWRKLQSAVSSVRE